MLAASESRARLFLLGIFHLEDAEGFGVPIPSKKARAMLGMLALSRGGRRSRVWLQDRLWGRCEKIEAQNNMRRELSSLRAVLANTLPNLLSVDRETVTLRLEMCEVDALQRDRGSGDAGVLLEGIDVPGEDGFEEWLRTERARREALPAAGTDCQIPAAPVVPTEAPADSRLVVGIHLEAWHNGALDAMALPDLLRQSIIGGLDEAGYFRVVVVTQTAPAEPADLDVWIKTTTTSDTLATTILCTRTAGRDALVTMQALFDLDRPLRALAPELQAFAARFVERLLHRSVAAADRDDGAHRARRRLLTAIEQMFSLNSEQVSASRVTLAEAHTFGEGGLFHAWRAYQAIFFHDPGHAYGQDLSPQECREQMALALDRDPYNGVSLSLCAHMKAFLFRDFAGAAEDLERAAASGTQHVMYYDALAMHRFYCGDLEGARVAALQASALGRHLPFRYIFSTSLCMIEGVSGNLEAAAAHGRRALAQEPASRTMSYPPTLRYLGAALAHLGRREEALQVFAELRSPLLASSDIQSGSEDTCLLNRRSVEFIRSGLVLIGL